jgi:wyosine [tRNA(Phe)-imidazoG37] synthetase (radical SAM superfamily)
MTQVIFGPVPSRRLGQSIGINHIPPKVCTYACRYCQLGKAIRMQTKRERFYEPEEIIRQVRKRLETSPKADFLTLVPDGEPALDARLDELITGLKKLNVPVAVISNASLLWDEQVRHALLKADRVSVKVDAATETVWRKVDRPHKSLDFECVKHGVRNFAKAFNGYLMTESMLIDGYNDGKAELEKIADYLSEINPDVAYIAIPTRPPADSRVKPASEKALQTAWALFSEKVKRAELLIGYEGNAFAVSGNAESDILSITAVHPMREDALIELLKNDRADMGVVDQLIDDEKLLRLSFGGHNFYLRKLKK